MLGIGINLWPRTAIGSLLQSLFPNGEQGFGIDFSDLTDEKLAWRKNRVLYSDDPGNTVWAKNVAIVVGKKVVPTTATTAYKGIQQTVSGVTRSVGRPFYAKARVKAAGYNFAHFTFYGNNGRAAFDLTGAGAVINVGGTASVVPDTDGYFIISYIGTTVTAGDVMAAVGPMNGLVDPSTPFAGDGVSGIEVDWVQLSDVNAPYQKISDVSTEFLSAFPYHSLFQDSMFLQPTCGLEQPIGGALDMRFGGLRGAELIVNGDFSSAVGWTNTGAAAVDTATGRGVFTDAATGAGIAQLGKLIVGKTYEIKYDIVAWSSGSARPYAGNGGPGVNSSGIGTFRTILTAASNSTFSITAIGTVVNLAIDNVSCRELFGNHATQVTPGDRPIVSARYNWLMNTEDIMATGWATTGPGVKTSSNLVTFSAPDGILYRVAFGVGTPAVGTPYTVSAELSGIGTVHLGALNGGGSVMPGHLVITLTSTPTRYTVTIPNSGVGANNGFCIRSTAAGTVTISKAQFELSPVAGRYQRVDSATDYDYLGFPTGARFNGINSWMRLQSIDPVGATKAILALSLRKESDSTLTIPFEYTNSYNSIVGGITVFAPLATNTADLAIGINALTSSVRGSPTTCPLGMSYVIASSLDMAGLLPADRGDIRVNASVLNNRTVTSGSAGVSAFPTAESFIGRRQGISNPYIGMMYRLSLRFGPTSASQLSALERWADAPTKVLQ